MFSIKKYLKNYLFSLSFFLISYPFILRHAVKIMPLGNSITWGILPDGSDGARL